MVEGGVDAMKREYRCYSCRGDYVARITEAEAVEEYRRNFGAVPDLSNTRMVWLCDECYQAALTVRRIRQEVERRVRSALVN